MGIGHTTVIVPSWVTQLCLYHLSRGLHCKHCSVYIVCPATAIVVTAKSQQFGHRVRDCCVQLTILSIPPMKNSLPLASTYGNIKWTIKLHYGGMYVLANDEI